MSRKLRTITVSVYVKFNEFNRLQGVNLSAIEDTLKCYISRRGKGKDCVAAVRVFPTFATANTVDVELTAFNENIDFINDTNADDGIVSLIDDFFDIDFAHFTIRQATEPLIVVGDFDR